MRAIDLADAIDELEAADLSAAAREIALAGINPTRLATGRKHQRVIARMQELLDGGESFSSVVLVVVLEENMTRRWIERLWQHHLRHRVANTLGVKVAGDRVRLLGETRANN